MSDLPTPPNPQEGRKLEAAATEGPWFAEAALTDDDDPAQIVGVAWPNPDGWAPVVCTPGSASFATEATNRDADASLIVWLRNNAAALLDAVEAVQRVRSLADAVRTLQDADPDTGDRQVSFFALLDALEPDDE